MAVIVALFGLGVLGTIVALLSLWQRGRHRADLGTLSPQWMAEQRQMHQNDSNR